MQPLHLGRQSTLRSASGASLPAPVWRCLARRVRRGLKCGFGSAATGTPTPRDRVIDRGVVKTLVAATAVQVGLIMVAIAGNLFPKAKADGKSWWKPWG